MKQITVVANDRVGLLADISYILGRSHINIETISVAAAGGKAFIHLGLSDSERAAELLRSNQYTVMEADVLVIKLTDKSGELAQVTKKLVDASVGVQNVSLLARDKEVCFYAIQVDPVETARRVLKHQLELEQ